VESQWASEKRSGPAAAWPYDIYSPYQLACIQHLPTSLEPAYQLFSSCGFQVLSAQYLENRKPYCCEFTYGFTVGVSASRGTTFHCYPTSQTTAPGTEPLLLSNISSDLQHLAKSEVGIYTGLFLNFEELKIV
jgi:hypothetical protein